MRKVAAFVILPVLLAGCLPQIPVRRDFGSSALEPSAETPAEFAQFNAYDPAVGPLVADQLCATPYIRMEEKNVAAVPGRIAEGRGACQVHRAFFGDGDFLPALPQ